VSRCSIILVHGTWGRGFFPKRRDDSLYRSHKRRWFEAGSPFRAGLDAALKCESLNWPIREFLWSGANSVHARDCAARELSEQLKRALQDDPVLIAIVIAHSHGGNVALRALQYLDSVADRVRLVTLATPFLRVFAHRSLQLSFLIRFLVWSAITAVLIFSCVLGSEWVMSATQGLPYIDDAAGLLLLVTPILAMGAGIYIMEWLFAIFTNLQTALAVEEEASYDAKGAAASDMLVIRGVDDEASLSLAAGAIGSRLSYLVLVGVIPAIGYISLLVMSASFSDTLFVYLGAAFSAPMLLVLPGVFKSVFGREFLVNALACDIAVDSVPDKSGQVEVITLRPVEAEREWTSVVFGFEVRNPYSSSDRLFSLRWFSEIMRIQWSLWRRKEVFPLKGRIRLRKSSWQLRHGIYNHPACMDEIVQWLRRVT
jgi:pimeloyl-ACP methyl ester carboxylesterase